MAALSAEQDSEARIPEAVRLVEELRHAQLVDHQNFNSRMSQMQRLMKQHMEVTQNLLKAITTLRQELDTSRAESRTLRQTLTDFNWKLSDLSAELLIRRSDEIAAQLDQVQRGQITQPPTRPGLPIYIALSSLAGPDQERQQLQ